MGNWNLNISGLGPHHNQNPACDVDLLARELVSKMVANGHTITSARLHHGAEEEFAPKGNQATGQPGNEAGEATAGGRTPPTVISDGEKQPEAV